MTISQISKAQCEAFDKKVVYLDCPECGKECKDHIRVYKYDDIHYFLRSSHVAIIEAEIARKNERLMVLAKLIDKFHLEADCERFDEVNQDLTYLKEELENLKI